MKLFVPMAALLLGTAICTQAAAVTTAENASKSAVSRAAPVPMPAAATASGVQRKAAPVSAESPARSGGGSGNATKKP